jgi:hypothetical protein
MRRIQLGETATSTKVDVVPPEYLVDRMTGGPQMTNKTTAKKAAAAEN